jgi:hypothetical protein
MQPEIEIVKSYKGWLPPIEMEGRTRRLLSAVPPSYLIGLRTIVLTDSTQLNHEQRRAKRRYNGRKVATRETLGRYHPPTPTQPAWIELRMDKILRGAPGLWLRIPLICDTLLSDTLYHEIGHHIHTVILPTHEPKEDAANRWRRQLEQLFYRRYHPYLTPLSAIFSTLSKYGLLKQSQDYRQIKSGK